MAITLLAATIHVRQDTGPVADQWGLPGFEGMLAVSTSLVGYLIVRRTSNPTGWIFTWLGFFSSIQYLAEQYATAALTPGSALPAAITVAWIAEWIWVPLVTSIGLLFLFFPDEHIDSRVGRAIAGVGLVGMLATFAVTAFLGPWVITWDVRNPYAINDSAAVYEVAFSLSTMLLSGSIVAAAVRLVSRLRRATGIRKQQLKWFVYASVFASISLVFGAIPATMAWGSKLAVAGIMGIAAASAIAVLRYRLYDIDVVINRTLVYTASTAILAAAYVGLVFSLQAILAPFTAESDLAVAGSTLAVAALFRPLRRRVQDFIDRRFYRRKFDAERTVADFSIRLRDEVELGSVISQLTHVVRETMEPAHVSLWMRPVVER